LNPGEVTKKLQNSEAFLFSSTSPSPYFTTIIYFLRPNSDPIPKDDLDTIDTNFTPEWSLKGF
jgi:hypothetical protein